jgi:hypothetical protein
LTGEELCKPLVQNTRIEKTVALSFIKSRGDGRAIAAFKEMMVKNGVLLFGSVFWDRRLRFRRILGWDEISRPLFFGG